MAHWSVCWHPREVSRVVLDGVSVTRPTQAALYLVRRSDAKVICQALCSAPVPYISVHSSAEFSYLVVQRSLEDAFRHFAVGCGEAHGSVWVVLTLPGHRDDGSCDPRLGQRTLRPRH